MTWQLCLGILRAEMRSVVMLGSLLTSLGGSLLLLLLLEGSASLLRAGAFAAFCSLGSLTSYMVLTRADDCGS